MKILIFSLLLALGAAQTPAGAGGVRLNKEFAVRLGQSATVRGAGLRAEFVSVLEDSRCPKGVDCIWAGNGKISLRLAKAGRAPATVELNTDLEPKSASYLEYEVVLVKLAPYPQADEPAGRKRYVATLLVRRKGAAAADSLGGIEAGAAH